MDRYLIAVLAEEAASKRHAFECWGIVNTIGLTAADRIKLDTDYAVARAEWMAAEVALAKAVATAAKPPRS